MEIAPASADGMAAAVACLRQGGVVAYPTESFYGLAVDAENERAIRKLFRVKGRKAERPVLILLPSLEAVFWYAARIPEVAERLMAAFWPGALTLVLEARPRVSGLLTAGTGKIGVRLSSHPVATALAAAMGRGITGTSANLSGRPGCCTAEEVRAQIGKRLDFILDAGSCRGQAPSTVLDVTVNPPLVLREGLIGRLELLPWSGKVAVAPVRDAKNR